MSYTPKDLENDLASLNLVADKAMADVDAKFLEMHSWLELVQDAIKAGGCISGHLLAKTPGKKRGVLGTINESNSNISQAESYDAETTPRKKSPARKKSRATRAKRKQEASQDIMEIDEENEDSLSKRRKTEEELTPPVLIPIDDTTFEEPQIVPIEKNKEPAIVAEVPSARLTRSRVERITIVKEFNETFVIEQVADKEGASTLPSAISSPDHPGDSRSDDNAGFKPPAPVKKLSPPPTRKAKRDASKSLSEAESETEPMPPLRLTRTKTRAMAKAAQKEAPEPPAEKKPVEKSAEKSTERSVEKSNEKQAGKSSEKSGEKSSGKSIEKSSGKSAEKSVEKSEKKSGDKSDDKSIEKWEDCEDESDDSSTSNHSHIVRPGITSFLKQKIGTPVGKTLYLSASQMGTPNTSNVLSSVHSFITKPAPASIKKERHEDFLLKLNKKTEEASKKREELIKQQTEDRMRKRQEKAMKVVAAREAIEKERAEKLRLQIAQEEEKLKQDMAKRKKLAQLKAAEAAKQAKRHQEEEMRRLAEEKKRQQDERKEEEEQRRLAEERKKEQEELERRQRALKEAEKAAALKAQKAVASKPKPQLDETYDMTPAPQERQPLKSKNAEDYGIDDAGCDDSSEDESHPKKEVPLWAQSKNRMPRLAKQIDIVYRQAALFFGSKKSTPDLSKMFEAIDKRVLIRKSSAVWRTPPIRVNRDF